MLVRSLGRKDLLEKGMVTRLGNSMDRGAGRAIVHRVTKSGTQLKRLRTHTHHLHGLWCEIHGDSSHSSFYIILHLSPKSSKVLNVPPSFTLTTSSHLQWNINTVKLGRKRQYRENEAKSQDESLAEIDLQFNFPY